MSTQAKLCGPSSLGTNPLVHAHVLAMFDVAHASGTVPRDRAALDVDDGVLWIEAGDAEVIAAAVFCDIGEDRLWLDFLYVHAAHRRQGHGRALLQRLKEVARGLGARKLMLGTDVRNAAMRFLAESESFGVEPSVRYVLPIGEAA